MVTIFSKQGVETNVSERNNMRNFWMMAVLLTALTGCSKDAELPVTREQAPRPVSVIKLRQSDPARSLAVTGVVDSWKTEDLGFEVSGRVQFVIEPESNVSDQAGDDENRQQLARLDPERYESAVDSAKAQIATLEKQKIAASIEEGKVLPAQQAAAVAAQDLAQADFNRAEEVFKKNAIAKSEMDQYTANLATAKAKVAQIDATKEAKSAEVASLDAQIQQAETILKDAVLDLKDCTLYAPFRGQIAEVHVIPGGTVQRGESVVTVQMMDPMKIEFEVSAERARQMHYKDTLDVILARPNGSDSREEAIIYMTDAVADPSTRTFTITLLVRNRQVPAIVPDDVDTTSLAKTRDIWACISGIVDDSNDYFIEQNAILKDDQGEYIWKVIEPGSSGGRSRGSLLKVKKVRVTAGTQTPSFLGLWTFREITINDPSTFDLKTGRVLGKLDLPDGATELTGNTVLFEREQWLLRPGDLAGVDLSASRLPSGFYVPINAIKEQSDKYFVFVVDDATANSKVRQVEVTISDGPNTQKRIEAIGDQTLTAGMQIVLGGVHYLSDGETVNVAAEVEGN
ncbi:MAG: multidrug efflux pump subunit AcrA (membrane-fusion protein) [Planctomycetaceae bacterium]|jgi:multidrug efflux pump subunit AcrA (membrane-fusion protein)